MRSLNRAWCLLICSFMTLAAPSWGATGVPVTSCGQTVVGKKAYLEIGRASCRERVYVLV